MPVFASLAFLWVLSFKKKRFCARVARHAGCYVNLDRNLFVRNYFFSMGKFREITFLLERYSQLSRLTIIYYSIGMNAKNPENFFETRQRFVNFSFWFFQTYINVFFFFSFCSESCLKILPIVRLKGLLKDKKLKSWLYKITPYRRIQAMFSIRKKKKDSN